MLGLWILVACRTAPEPPPPLDPIDDPDLARPPAEESATGAWRLTGRYRPGALDLPAWPEARAILPEDCDGTCLAERWASPVGERWFLRSRDRAWSQDGPDAPRVPLPHQWRTLGSVLTACLGDPLRLPPAWDAGGGRGYDGTDWVLLLTGQNPCGLDGTLRLRAGADRIDSGLLAVDGKPWDRGGREAARAHADAYGAAGERGAAGEPATAPRSR